MAEYIEDYFCLLDGTTVMHAREYEPEVSVAAYREKCVAQQWTIRTIDGMQTYSPPSGFTAWGN